MGRPRGDVRHTSRIGRRSRHAERVDHSARAGIPLDARDDLARRLDQHPALRPHGPVRRRADAAIRRASNDDGRDGALAVCVGLATRITAAWQLVVIWGIGVGLATGMVAIVLGATVVNRWFVERRGLALGILTASTATGQLVFLPMLASMIEHTDGDGRSSSSPARRRVTIVVVALFMREYPEDVGAAPLGGVAEWRRDARARRIPFGAALGALRDGARSRDFWLLFATFFICGASTNGLVGTHLIPAAHDHGIPEVRAAGLVAMMGVFDLFGTTGSGWLTDRWDSRALLAWYYSLRGLSLMFLPRALAGGAKHESRGVRGVVRTRLDRHRSADGEARDGRVRQGARADHVRMDRRGPPTRRGDGGVGRGLDPHDDRRLSSRVLDVGRALSRRGRVGAHCRQNCHPERREGSACAVTKSRSFAAAQDDRHALGMTVYFASSRTQIFRKLIGALGSPCACNRIDAAPCALYSGCPMYFVSPRSAT